MLTEELGLRLNLPRPGIAALTTFLGFSAAGLVPLLPYLIPGLPQSLIFPVSTAATGVTFIAIGVLKGRILDYPLFRSGMETLLVGGAAATLAYLVGLFLRGLVG